ncbi:DUF6427 family protein [Planktosalinus lacus]|uniref:Uncharacterized protein n=1 Tax=Planktosalinus lacus TaxID=1526573 RepID=A0A8J2Y4H2_9FLAO|nr:DUF6427 family protein [Planktosalinus lacus]GGD79988.1 hypothetical protein GCM10011312_00390 [Planktosalinus lacus]
MLTSFFGKSKPVNYVLVAAFMALFFLGHYFKSTETIESFSEIAFQVGMLLIFLLTMLLVDFISRKNKLTYNNTYLIVVFGIFITTIPASFLNAKVLVAHFFILLALRRMISLRSQKDVQKKLFDAALWISLASCFYFWSFLFVIFLFGSIVALVGRNFKNYVIPFVGMATVIILSNVYTLLVQNTFYSPLDWIEIPGFDFTSYNQFSLLLPASVFFTVMLWLSGHFLFKRKVKNKKQKTKNFQLYSLTLIALAIVIFTPHKNGSELAFSAMPFAVLTTNYLETKEEKGFKELLLWLLVLLPFLILFIQ